MIVLTYYHVSRRISFFSHENNINNFMKSKALTLNKLETAKSRLESIVSLLDQQKLSALETIKLITQSIRELDQVIDRVELESQD